MIARFPFVQKTSRGDSREVLLQMQGNDWKGVGHLGIESWYEEEEEEEGEPCDTSSKTETDTVNRENSKKVTACMLGRMEEEEPNASKIPEYILFLRKAT
jgi:hypothetical protein